MDENGNLLTDSFKKCDIFSSNIIAYMSGGNIAYIYQLWPLPWTLGPPPPAATTQLQKLQLWQSFDPRSERVAPAPCPEYPH